MKLLYLAGCALALSACGPDREVCPTGWSDNASSPGSCEAPTSFTQTVGTGVYGFVRTTAHGGNKLVVGATVFALPGSSTTCDAASVNAIATTTTTTDGVFQLTLAPGSYRITSGEVPACVAVQVDANNATDVALTYP